MSARPIVPVARAHRWPFLHRLHPLAKLVATTPVAVALLFPEGIVVPAVIGTISLVLVLVGVRMRPRARFGLVAGTLLSAAVLSVSLSVWVDARAVADTTPLLRLGDWTWYSGALRLGAATALRLVAIMLVALLGGLATAGSDLVRALVEQLHVPYRFGYAGLAAFRFVPRFRTELQVIRQAQALRGLHTARTPAAALRRWSATLVPLIAGALRHADRVALSMDARGFGYRPTRTNRHPLPLRWSDWLFAAAFLLVVAAVFVVGAMIG